jgi:hypothetical protein
MEGRGRHRKRPHRRAVVYMLLHVFEVADVEGGHAEYRVGLGGLNGGIIHRDQTTATRRETAMRRNMVAAVVAIMMIAGSVAPGGAAPRGGGGARGGAGGGGGGGWHGGGGHWHGGSRHWHGHGRWHGHRHWHGGWWGGGVFIGSLGWPYWPYGYPYPYLGYPYRYPYPVYSAEIAAPSVSYYERQPIQREVVYPNGKYVLYGDGVTQAWQWVWIPTTHPSPSEPR